MSGLPHFHQCLVLSDTDIFVPQEDTKWNNTMALTCICLITYEEEDIFACILTICVFSSVKGLPFAIFLLDCLLLVFMKILLAIFHVSFCSMIFAEQKFLTLW